MLSESGSARVPDDLIAAVNAKEPGDEVALTVLRDGSGRDVTVELGDRPDSLRG